MKFVFSLIFLGFLSNEALSQTMKYVRIAQVKECTQIDSVLDEAIKFDKFPINAFAVVQLYFPSYLDYNLSIYFFKPCKFYNIPCTDKLGFFKYKGYTIFTIGINDPFYFLYRTGEYKDFNVVPADMEIFYHDTDHHIIYFNFFKYQNNQLVYPFVPVR